MVSDSDGDTIVAGGAWRLIVNVAFAPTLPLLARMYTLAQ
jgi:hypothetical protein